MFKCSSVLEGTHIDVYLSERPFHIFVNINTVIFRHNLLSYLTVGLVVIDCSASSETVETLKQVQSHGCCIVLANKKPLTCAIVIFFQLFNLIESWKLLKYFIFICSCLLYRFTSQWCNQRQLIHVQEDHQQLMSDFRRIRFESTVCSNSSYSTWHCFIFFC